MSPEIHFAEMSNSTYPSFVSSFSRKKHTIELGLIAEESAHHDQKEQ